MYLQQLYNYNVYIHICTYLHKYAYIDIQSSSVAQPCLTICDPMNCSTPSLPVHYQLPESTQNHVH